VKVLSEEPEREEEKTEKEESSMDEVREVVKRFFPSRFSAFQCERTPEGDVACEVTLETGKKEYVTIPKEALTE
jgi:hypothetical protein